MEQILSQFDSNPDSIESAESVVGKALDYLKRL